MFPPREAREQDRATESVPKLASNINEYGHFYVVENKENTENKLEFCSPVPGGNRGNTGL
jgi:hypothetical protein